MQGKWLSWRMGIKGNEKVLDLCSDGFYSTTTNESDFNAEAGRNYGSWIKWYGEDGSIIGSNYLPASDWNQFCDGCEYDNSPTYPGVCCDFDGDGICERTSLRLHIEPPDLSTYEV